MVDVARWQKKKRKLYLVPWGASSPWNEDENKLLLVSVSL
jgi:hypothetical protein